MTTVFTNIGSADLPLASPDGTVAVVLPPGQSYTASPMPGVLIAGHKPGVREQIEQAIDTLTDAVRTFIDWLRDHEPVPNASETPWVSVAVHNGESYPLRVILGNGLDERTVEPGDEYQASAEGYIEIRALGQLDDSQKDGGTQPAVA